MGPVMDLDPGQRLAMTWELAACRSAGAIRAVAAGGVVADPAPGITDGRLRGSFGVFVRGKVVVRRAGVEVASVACTPLEALQLDLRVPPGEGVLELVVVDEGGAEFPLITMP